MEMRTSDAIMAANTSEGTRTVEAEETHEECSGKKKSKFQAFKKLFVKKKRKEPTTPSRESNLKPSQSSTDVSASGANTIAFHVDEEKVAKVNMGTKAVSHDSVFILEMESSVKEDISQECTPGKVKALQLQLQQNIRIGSPPQGIVPKKLEDSGALSEDDGLPRSPPEITSLHEILAQSSGKSSVSAQRRSSISLGGTDSEEDPEFSELSSRPTSPLHSNVRLCPTSSVSHFPLADFTSPASSVSCLDNSAAKHKILVKPKKRRAPNMSGKPTQYTEETNTPAVMKKEEENYNMMEEQQPVKILDSEKMFEHEAPSEEVKNIEDALLQKPNEDTIESVCELQTDISHMNSKNSNAHLLLEASLLEDQILSFQTEEVCSETDVDGSRMSIENKIDASAEDSKRDEVITSSQTCDFHPSHENNEIIDMVKPSELNHVKSPESNIVQIENPNLNTSQGLVCGALGNYQPNLEKAEAAAVSEIIDKECNGLGKVLPSIEKDLLNVIKSDLVEGESLQDCVLSLEPVTPMIKNEEVQVVQVPLEYVDSYETNDEEHPGTILQNAELLLEVSDQLVETNESKIEYSPSKEEPKTFDMSNTESNDEQSDIGGVNDSKAPTTIINANDSGYTDVSTIVPDIGLLSKSETSTEIVKVIKAAEQNPESNVKGSAKPVRFTVTPAWQRALPSGSSIKDSPFIKNMVVNIDKSESFDGVDESVVQNSKKNNVQKNKEESSAHFGIRLRRTSSSIKYSEDHQEVSSKQGISSGDNSSLLSERNMQSPKKTQVNTDCAQITKISPTNEEKATTEIKIQAKSKAEDSSPQENSEPAWITMAKLKQKGFQEHPLAREQSSTVENEKVEVTECILQKNLVTSPQEVEAKKTEQTAADSPVELLEQAKLPVAPEEAQPNSEKISRPTQPQNPDEPPWFSLAKKKAKAWSEMPQIVQQ
ncbi:acrosomal protein KIAA1210 homolog isoform X2 [Dendrobates tinctorius]|uniref:acrosomal protein KIAA1210 homolog isoform X2 n=1 Tax=Dendrobates tinctorius TaxID=92724 RepID=UPI003CC93CAB